LNIKTFNTDLIELFEEWAKEKIISIKRLPLSGSNRQYFRIISNTKNAIGVFNNKRNENIAFISFTKHFFNKGLNVPEIYSENLDKNIYLIKDLGDKILLDVIEEKRTEKDFQSKIKKIYKNVINDLIKFQIVAGKDIDYSKTYPVKEFNKQAMLWDLNYFKYYFLKTNNIIFNEQKLEEDFNTLTNHLKKNDNNYFMYRDFQSRNIIIYNEKLYYIDYQGGRKGGLQYDLASLLFQAKADLPQNLRDELLLHYIKEVKKYINIDEKEFVDFYYLFVFLRLMQVLGAYGFRGLYEKKPHFIKSIKYAVKNLEWLYNTHKPKIILPELFNVFEQIIENKEKNINKKSSSKLVVSINSFSYKKEIPKDNSGNGGGFVFDCRALPNPGRYEKYINLSGKDKIVRDFFIDYHEMNEFLNNIYKIVDQSIDNYIERNFTSLMVNFGCTGGQHRSVFCAEHLAGHLKNKYNITVKLKHLEENNWGKYNI